jgi:hypothetical protein
MWRELGDVGLIDGVAGVSNNLWSVEDIANLVVHNYTEASTDVAGNTGQSAGVALFSTSFNKALTGGTGADVLIAAPNDNSREGR